MTYTLTITNLEGVDRTYGLASTGLVQVDLPAQVNVPAGSSASQVITAQTAYEGSNVFTISAREIHDYASAQTAAMLNGVGFSQVVVQVDPSTASGGPGVPTLFDAMVTNLGSQPEEYAVSVAAPSGWGASLFLLGNPVDSVLVGPGVGNGVTLQLMLTPAASTPPGSYDFTFNAVSAAASASDSADARRWATWVYRYRSYPDPLSSTLAPAAHGRCGSPTPDLQRIATS